MDEHESLLEEWKATCNPSQGFIKDGIIDPNRWETAPKKILVILKEGYNTDRDPLSWDVRTVILENELFGTSFRETAYCAYCALNNRSLPECSPKDALGALRSIAVINLKKTPGGRSSSLEEIQAHIAPKADYVKKQISLINPDWIVCGYTWRLISEHVTVTSHPTPNSYIDTNDRIIIDFWHPANRFPRLMNCATLVTILRMSGAYNDAA